MAKTVTPAKKVLERLRTSEPAATLATELGVRDSEVLLAREVLRHIGEHQAQAAGRLPDTLAQAVVEAALQIEQAEFLKAVAEHGGKGAASAARRALAILRSKGIEVELAAPAEAVYRPVQATAEELSCFITPPTGEGERALWIPRPQRGGGLALVTAVLSDTQGIVQIEEAETSRKGFRRILQQFSQPGPRGTTLLEVPLAVAKGHLARARARSGGLDVASEALVTGLLGDPAAAEPQAMHEPPLRPEMEQARLQESAQLHQERDLAHWVPTEDAIRSLSLRLEEVATSSLFVDEAQRTAQSAREVERAVDDFFSGDRRQLYAERLFEMADAFVALGNRDAGERAAATARALREGSAAPSSIPFCRRLFEKVLGLGRAAPAPTAPGAETEGEAARQ